MTTTDLADIVRNNIFYRSRWLNWLESLRYVTKWDISLSVNSYVLQLSRPQVVKKIWEYIKARDLQDPADKRQILCDERMHAVFKSDRVHMFTMNKILGNQLYPVEES